MKIIKKVQQTKNFLRS